MNEMVHGLTDSHNCSLAYELCNLPQVTDANFPIRYTISVSFALDLAVLAGSWCFQRVLCHKTHIFTNQTNRPQGKKLIRLMFLFFLFANWPNTIHANLFFWRLNLITFSYMHYKYIYYWLMASSPLFASSNSEKNKARDRPLNVHLNVRMWTHISLSDN